MSAQLVAPTTELPRFRVGDVVQLKCEHTRMVVEKIEGQTVHTVYMTSALLVIRDNFPAPCLKLIREEV